MFGYVYKTTNLINGKQYIGRKTSTVFVPSYHGSGVALLKVVQKYGKENFNTFILCPCETYDELVLMEMYCIKLYDAVKRDDFYNQSYGGFSEGFDVGERNIAKLPENRRKNSEAHKGKKMSEEFCNLQSRIHKGKPSGMKGHYQSDYCKQQVSKSSKQQKHSKQRDEAVSNHHKGSKMMTNGDIQLWVYKSEIDLYLQNGFIFGSCKPRNRTSLYSNKGLSTGKVGTCKNKKCVTNGSENRFIDVQFVEEFLLQNPTFRLGMTRHVQ